MSQSLRPQPYYPTSGGSQFSSKPPHGLKVGLGGPLWTPPFDCKSLHLLTFLISGFSHTSSLPIGVFAFLATNVTGFLPRYFDHKYIILFGGALLITASAMLPFTDSPDTYWRLSFPAFIIGTIGCTIVYSNSK